jgi:hypothetical protein
VRCSFVVVAMLSACTGASEHAHQGLPYLYVPPDPPRLPVGCTGGSDNELAIGSSVDADLPVIVLDDDFLPCFGMYPPRPRVAIWSDGTIVFARDGVDAGDARQELVQGSIPATAVDELVTEVADAVEHSPRAFDSKGIGGETSLLVRVHGQWRAATVTGAFPSAFIGESTPPPPPPPPPSLGSDARGRSFEQALAAAARPQSIAPPPAFARAYQALLAARPADGGPITRDDLSVAFFPLRVLGGEARTRELVKTAWPIELPQPPVDVAPCADDVECVRDVAPAHRESADKLRRDLQRSDFKLVFEARGQRFLSRFDSHYHGERTIQQLEVCAAHLGADH